MKHRTGAGWVLVLALISLAGAGFQSSADLFQKALRLERSEGDLKGALAVYKQIVEKNDDEALAAQAQFRLGVCLEKLGRAEARAAFQLVVDRYPRQTETVREAREKIAVLAGAETIKPEIPSDFSLRRIWSDPGIDLYSRISPDGRYLAYRQTGTGNLAVRDLNNGTIRLIRANPPENIGREHVTGISWSSDGTRLAYLWGTYYSQESNSWMFPELYLFDFSSKTSRQIPMGKEWGIHQLLNWPSESSKIFVRVTDIRSNYFVGFISVDDGKFAPIQKANTHMDEYLISPDARWVACAKRIRPAQDGLSRRLNPSYSLSLFSLDNRVEKEILADSWAIRLVAWDEEGKRIFFLKNNSGKMDLYALSIRQGQPAEETDLIRQDLGDIEPLGLSRENEIYFIKSDIHDELQSFCFDAETGRVTEPGRVISRSYENCDFGFDLSPGGRSLAYITGRVEVSASRTLRHIEYVCIYSFENGRYRDYGIDERSESAWVKWIDDHTLRISLVTNQIKSERILDVSSGQWTLQEKAKSEEMKMPVFNNPQRSLFASSEKYDYLYLISDSSGGSGIKTSVIRVDRKTKEEAEICSHIGSSSLYPFISPDQKEFVSIARESWPRKEYDPEKIVMVSMDTGAAREVFVNSIPDRHLSNAEWTPDSRGLVVSQIIRQVDPTVNRPRSRYAFWFIPRDGSPAKRIGYESKTSNSFGPHVTDGRRVVFNIGAQSQGELWIMENALKRKK